MGAIFRREFKAYFTSPIGYAVLAIFYFFSGLFFGIVFQSGSPDLSNVFSSLFLIIMGIIPLLTMRLFSEDRRQKTDQLLFTSPVRLTSVVMGKFFAAFCVFLLSLVVVVAGQIIISFYITPDWMVFLGTLLGVILLGGALIALGMFISALTESQIVAAIASIAIELLLYLVDTLAGLLNNATVTKIVGWISINNRYTGFTSGVFDYSNAVFFVTFAALFIFLTIRVLDRKRYA